MNNRDVFLDRLRSIAIVWVLVIHGIYWLGFFPSKPFDVIRSWLLLEMPLFFFITGAGQALSTPKSWGRYVAGSFRRMLIPYWLYALLCLLLNGLKTGHVNPAMVWQWLIPTGAQSTEVQFLTSALWYVPVFLLCSMVTPVLRRFQSRPWPVVGLLVTLLLFFERMGWSYPQNVAFYSLWIFIGLHYPQLKVRYWRKSNRRWELLLLGGAAVAALVFVCRSGIATADMQENKFPPNGIFLLYSLGAMSFFALVAPGLVGFVNCLCKLPPLGWMIHRLGQYSLSVYLYHPLIFVLLARYMYVFYRIPSHALRFVVCCGVAVFGAVVLTVVFGPLERLGRRKKS